MRRVCALERGILVFMHMCIHVHKQMYGRELILARYF